jgi:hypothetical protein
MGTVADPRENGPRYLAIVGSELLTQNFQPFSQLALQSA